MTLIHHTDNHEDVEVNAECESFFEVMLPFFRDNANLVCLIIRYGFSPWVSLRTKQVMCECTSLKRLSIINQYGGVYRGVAEAEEDLIRELATQSSLLLKKFSVDTTFIGKRSSLAIKSMLADPTCKLKSFSLTRSSFREYDINDEETIVSNIGCGLPINENTSVEHLYFEG